MANTKGFKRLVRARMARTGESYMVAMHALQRELAEKSAGVGADNEDARAEEKARQMINNIREGKG